MTQMDDSMNQYDFGDWSAICRKPGISRPAPGAKVYPFLLRNAPDQPGVGGGHHLPAHGQGLPLPGVTSGFLRGDNGSRIGGLSKAAGQPCVRGPRAWSLGSG